MPEWNIAEIFRTYFIELKHTQATGKATEHSYRPAFQKLIHDLGGANIHALNEPVQIECGAPDFIVNRRNVPIGHIECKDIGANLNQVECDEQLKRYRDGLPNLILTDYLEFRWYSAGELREVCKLGHRDKNGVIQFDKTSVNKIMEVFDAFFTAEVKTIDNPRELAERMAAKTRILRNSIVRIFNRENEVGPLHELLSAYRNVLIAGLEVDQFADMQAQTAAYGLFAARCIHKVEAGQFTRQSAFFANTTPFLQAVFGRIAGPDIDAGIAWIVEDLALLLNQADMEAVLANFGTNTRIEDPVVHFYEDFLAAYDNKLRKVRGVYYTPKPVVSYIVQSIDILLRDKFALDDGLADTTSICQDESNDEQGMSPRVLILDPAAGTGTFLCETVVSIRNTIKEKGLGGTWSEYVRTHLLPRLFGFELLMAPYAICHLKLALEIGGTDTGFSIPDGQSLGVFLTNTLEKAHETSPGPMFIHEITREAARANAMKRDKPVMVVIGNPPYSGESANKGKWINGLLRGAGDEEERRNYFEVDGHPLGEKNPKWLHDDYVKFFRFAQWRIERTGEGVLGFVTNHSYLDNPTFRGMRHSLMETFDEIYVLDLHGSVTKSERSPDGGKDENVFDIKQGVAIGLFVKYADSVNSKAQVFHTDLWGQRDTGFNGGKYGWLRENNIKTTEWAELSPLSPNYLFVPRDEALSKEYQDFAKITDIFPVNSVGIVTARDKLVVQHTANKIEEVANDFVSRSIEGARQEYGLGKDSKDWTVTKAQEDIRDHFEAKLHVKPILYRPFDKRFTWYTGRSSGFICRPREKVMHHMLAGSNLGLISCRQQSQVGIEWGFCSVTRLMIESCAISNKTKEINYLFPLYLYPDDSRYYVAKQVSWTPNLSDQIVKGVSSSIGLDFVSYRLGDLKNTFGPEDFFNYIYAVLHSRQYRHRYSDFLKSDFPRIPFTSNCAKFANLSRLGQRLVNLHLLDAELQDLPKFLLTGNNRVDKVCYEPLDNDVSGRVWINDQQCFDGLSPNAWTFVIGSYCPAQKWLKDRKGKILTYSDIDHYRHICASLAETIHIMSCIDETIDFYGGWPFS